VNTLITETLSLARECADVGEREPVEGTPDGFVVEDTGPGLPEDIAASMFGGEYSDRRQGIGLLIIERVVSGHDWEGSVEADSEGTRFVFSGIEAATEAQTADSPA